MSLNIQHIASGNITTNAASYTTNSVTVPANRLLIGFIHTASGAGANALVVPSLDGFRTPFATGSTVVFNTIAAPANRLTMLYAWTTQQITGPFTGAMSQTQAGAQINIFSVSGMFSGHENRGLDAIQQIVSGVANAVANPTVTLRALHPSGQNAVIFGFGNDINPFGATPEAGWTESYDVGYNTPAAGAWGGFRLATTDNTVSGTRAAADWAGIAVEIRDDTVNFRNRINIQGKAFIAGPKSVTITGRAHILNSTIDVAWARFETPEGTAPTDTKSLNIQGRARIQNTSSTSIEGKARIQKAGVINQQGVANIVAPAENNLLTDLIAHWKLDEASGTRADSHGSNHLTPVTAGAAIGNNAGIIGNAVSFVSPLANAQYLEIADNTDLSVPSTSFTLAGWANPRSSSQDITIGGKWEQAASQLEYLLYFDKGEDRFYFFVRSADNTTSVGLRADTAVITPSAWYFVAAWYDADAQTINIQVNNGTIYSQSWTAGVRDGTASFRIGRYNANYSDGYVDSVSFWKRALTSDERTAVYNNGNGLDYDEFSAEEGDTTNSVFVSGRARIQNSGSIAQTGKARIQRAAVINQTGISRITNSSSTSITGKARIQNSSQVTQTGKARIQSSASITQQGKARISRTETTSIQGKARIQNTRVINQQGKARITQTASVFQSGKARIQKSATFNISGLARISRSVSLNIQGKARLANTAAITQTGKARIQKAGSTSILGKARITNTASLTQTGKARVTNSASVFQSGKASITAAGFDTNRVFISGRARITATNSVAQTGKARVQKSVSIVQTGKARISQTGLVSQSGKARITNTSSLIQLGKARITNTTSVFISGKASITPAGFATNRVFISGKASIRNTSNVTQTGVARIQKAGALNISGRARILVQNTLTQTGVARIKKTESVTITGQARISRSGSVTIQGKARIDSGGVSIFQSGVARIQNSASISISGKAAIHKTSSVTIQGVARIVLQKSIYISGKAKIANVSSITITGRANIINPLLRIYAIVLDAGASARRPNTVTSTFARTFVVETSAATTTTITQSPTFVSNASSKTSVNM